MRIGKVTLAAAAIAAASVPIAGQAIAAERSAAPIADESSMGGGATVAVIFGLAAFVALVFLSGDDEEPASP